MSSDYSTSLSRRGYTIIKEKFPSQIIKEIRKELTVTPDVYDAFGGGNVSSYQVYQENHRKMYLPRYYGLNKIGDPQKIKIKSGKKIDITFKGALKENQIEPISIMKDTLNTKGGGILSLGCGGGKTVCAINLVCHYKVKTLVVVNRDFLLNQWKERIKQFSDAKIGIIKQKTIIVEDCDIVIAMLHSLSLKEYSDSIFKEFGFVIVDECHHISSRVFSKALPKIACKYTLGLTATPERQDKLSCVFYWYLGDISYQKKEKLMNETSVQIIKYRSDSELFEPVMIQTQVKSIFNVAGMINNITEHELRNQYIIQMIRHLMNNNTKEYKDTNRYILVLSERREHLKKLKHACELLDLSCGLYIGGMKPPDLKRSETKDIIFATSNLVQEAFDLPKLNTLIMTTPKKNIEQMVGRIQRKIHNITPLIIDIQDQFANFINQGRTRLSFYKKKNYKIEVIEMFNNIENKRYEVKPKAQKASKKPKSQSIEETTCIL